MAIHIENLQIHRRVFAMVFCRGPFAADLPMTCIMGKPACDSWVHGSMSGQNHQILHGSHPALTLSMLKGMQHLKVGGG